MNLYLFKSRHAYNRPHTRGPACDARIKARVSLAFFAALTFAAGCQQIKVDTSSDPAFDTTSVKTYAWFTNASQASGINPANLTLLRDTLQAAIEENLAAKGWQLRDERSADVLVRYVVGAEDQFEAVQTGVTHIAGQRVVVPLKMKKLRAGRLAIDLVDPLSGTIIWRGAAGVTNERELAPDELVQTVRQGVQAIIQKIP